MLNFSPPRCHSSRKPAGAKLALKPVHVWGIRVWLQIAGNARDLALFDSALDSKLRGCDLVSLKVGDLLSASGVKRRVVILQQKTRPTSAVRSYRAGSSIDWALDRSEEAKCGGLAVPEPNEPRSQSEHSAVCPAGGQVGYARGSRSGRVRHPQHAPD